MATQLAKGNTAVIIGALYAGCDSFFGYPITPASELLSEAVKKFPKAGRKVVQAESEEAAINMVYGAAATGRRTMTGSSGPGISLKQEGISYLAGTMLPAVVVDIMRAGPGLGNIGPEQGDYNQIVKGGGHGNYRNIVLAPNSVQEMCDFTMQAFELGAEMAHDGFRAGRRRPGADDRTPALPRATAWRRSRIRAGPWTARPRRARTSLHPSFWISTSWKPSTSSCRKSTRPWRRRSRISRRIGWRMRTSRWWPMASCRASCRARWTWPGRRGSRSACSAPRRSTRSRRTPCWRSPRSPASRSSASS